MKKKFQRNIGMSTLKSIHANMLLTSEKYCPAVKEAIETIERLRATLRSVVVQHGKSWY